MERPYPERPHLSDSRLIHWTRTTSSEAAAEVVRQIVAEIDAKAASTRTRARKVADRRSLEATARAMTLDVFVAAEQDQRPWVAYSRRREEYSESLSRYLSPDVRYKAAVEVADFLVEAGYAHGAPGSYRRTDHGDGWVSGRGYRSRLRATDKLVDLFKSRGVRRADIHDAETTELIRLKGSPEGSGGRKPLMTYEDTDVTVRMRRELCEWATLTNRFAIEAPGVDLRAVVDHPSDDDEDGSEYVDATVATLYRVFNDGVWSRGGRFYGGWWQSLPKARRGSITIDGEPTVELDFKALHPRLLYHLERRPLDLHVDPYTMNDPWRETSRDLIKVAFNQLLALNGEGLPRKPKDKPLPEGETYKALVAGIEARHRSIGGWFRKGLASRLQNIDAQIASVVLNAFVVSRRRPALPIHDSFIVAKRDEVALGQTMCMAYFSVMKEMTGIGRYPAIEGWSSSETRASAYAPFDLAGSEEV